MFRGVRLGVPICEDIWSDEVVECLAETGAELLIVPNGSPYWRGKHEERVGIVTARVVESGLPIVYVNQIGGQDELVFDGASFALHADRSLAFQMPAFVESVTRTVWERQDETWICTQGPRVLVEEGDEADYAACVLGLRDYVDKNRFPGVVMGLSGGVDSALCAAGALDLADTARLLRIRGRAMQEAVPVGLGAMAALLAPIGLAGPALWVMEQAGAWILFVAHWVAGLQGAVTPIVQPGPWVMPLITFAGIWAVLWRGRARWAAIAPLVIGLALWASTMRPILLISSDGALVGLMGAQGRALSVARGAGFTAENWLQDDGDLALQTEAYARAGFSGPQGARAFELDGWRGVALSGKAAAEALLAACAQADLVVMPAAVIPAAAQPKDCIVIDRNMLDQTGALGLSVRQGR
ncbi:MAG: hypothetical protein B7Y02_16740, partial [Rhodobacterales bacterium 17-64-5]